MVDDIFGIVYGVATDGQDSSVLEEWCLRKRSERDEDRIVYLFMSIGHSFLGGGSSLVDRWKMGPGKTTT